MPYVSRDDAGNITGTYARLQPGFAEELLPDDDPELMAFLDPPAPINPALNSFMPPTIRNILTGE